MTGAEKHFGYRRDETRHRIRQKDARHLLGAVPAQAVSEAASLTQFAAPIMDQGATSSCVGHGTAQAIYIAVNSLAATQGAPAPSWVPSPGGIYRIARSAPDVRPSSDMPLLDDGAYPANAMWGVGYFGIRPIEAPTSDGRYSDIEPDNVNVDEPFEKLEEAGLKIIVGEYRVDEMAADVIDQCKKTIDVAKAPLGVGFQVDPAFMNATGGNVIDAPSGKILGGHWVCVAGYRPSLLYAGETDFEVINSWSTGWGDGGRVWCTQRWLAAAMDIYAMTVRSTT